MTTVDLYGLTIKLLKKLDKENPGKTFTNKAGEKATIPDIIKCLSMMKCWLYPALRPEDVTKVVRCKNCAYYKKYKRKGAIKAQTFYACSKDMARRTEDFYCKDGEERA